MALGAGCGGAGGAKSSTNPARRLSSAHFVRAADRACARVNQRLKGVPRATSLEKGVKELQSTLIPALERLIAALRRLEPPQHDSVTFQRLLTAFDGEDLAAHHLLSSARTRQVKGAKTAARQLTVQGRRARSLAKTLGLLACVKAA